MTRARRAIGGLLLLLAALLGAPRAAAQPRADRLRAAALPAADTAIRLDAGRFTVLTYPGDLPLARALLRRALERDSFPGLPRPTARALIAIAPDEARFRAWSGPSAPHWGAAIAIPALGRVVLRGGQGAAEAGDPHVVLRHELAHLVLHEAMGELPPRWFDEGYASYAAGEWGRDEVLVANLALLYRRMPALDSLDRRFWRGEREAQSAYALSHRAVAELAALDPQRGLALFFRYWRESEQLDPAVRRAYGITLDDFERHWQSRTRRRYGVLAFVGELTAGAGFAVLVVLPLYVLRRRRDRLRWEALRAAEPAWGPEEWTGEGADAPPDATEAVVEGESEPRETGSADTNATVVRSASERAQPFA